jgi:hypothetical protein
LQGASYISVAAFAMTAFTALLAFWESKRDKNEPRLDSYIYSYRKSIRRRERMEVKFFIQVNNLK